MRPVQLVASLALSLVGCMQIADIKEYKYDPSLDESKDGGADAAADASYRYPDDAQCADYCATVESACPTAFKDQAYCEKVCPSFPLADKASNKTGNTFECRLDQLKTAQEIGPEDSREHCLRAGPGGDGVCGSDCDSYCQLYSKVCVDFPQLATDCVNQCQKLVSDPNIDAAEAFGAQVDTIQCRLAHLSAAAFQPDPHCKHASLYVDEHTPCYTSMPNCDDYCALMQNVCTEDAGTNGENMQQYESFEDCRALCVNGLVNSEEILRTETQDKTRDTLACRRYHVYNHLLFKGSHCEHAGPGGDGHCGRVCPAYCQLVKKACGSGFAMQFEDDAACEADCGKNLLKREDPEQQVDLHYNIETGKKPGNTIQCRLYHATKAFRSPSTSCTSALGGGDCAP